MNTSGCWIDVQQPFAQYAFEKEKDKEDFT